MIKRVKLFCMVVLMTAATLVFMSCSKENKIEGKWKIVYASSEFSDDKGETWTFRGNKTWSGVVEEEPLDGDWSISKDELTIESSYEYYDYNGDYNHEKCIGEFSIDKLTGRELSISGKWTVKNDDGYRATVTANYEFEKK